MHPRWRAVSHLHSPRGGSLLTPPLATASSEPSLPVNGRTVSAALPLLAPPSHLRTVGRRVRAALSLFCTLGTLSPSRSEASWPTLPYCSGLPAGKEAKTRPHFSRAPLPPTPSTDHLPPPLPLPLCPAITFPSSSPTSFRPDPPRNLTGVRTPRGAATIFLDVSDAAVVSLGVLAHVPGRIPTSQRLGEMGEHSLIASPLTPCPPTRPLPSLALRFSRPLRSTPSAPSTPPLPTWSQYPSPTGADSPPPCCRRRPPTMPCLPLPPLAEGLRGRMPVGPGRLPPAPTLLPALPAATWRHCAILAALAGGPCGRLRNVRILFKISTSTDYQVRCHLPVAQNSCWGRSSRGNVAIHGAPSLCHAP